MALMLLRCQLAILSQLPSQVQTGFQILQGLALGCSLGIPTSFQVTLGVNLTCWVSVMCDFSLSLPIVVIDGLYELTKVQQGDGPVMVHHLVFDTLG